MNNKEQKDGTAADSSTTAKETPSSQTIAKPIVGGSFLLRVFLSPIIFLWGLVMLAAGTLFPITFLVMISFFGLLLEPFVWLLRKSGADIIGIEPFIDDTGNNALGHFLGFTIHIWGAFAVAYLYIKDGVVFTGE